LPHALPFFVFTTLAELAVHHRGQAEIGRRYVLYRGTKHTEFVNAPAPELVQGKLSALLGVEGHEAAQVLNQAFERRIWYVCFGKQVKHSDVTSLLPGLESPSSFRICLAAPHVNELGKRLLLLIFFSTPAVKHRLSNPNYQMPYFLLFCEAHKAQRNGGCNRSRTRRALSYTHTH
jgi:hypothetical protein